MNTAQDAENVTEELGRSWNQFWFTPADTLPCSVLRIIVGLLATAHFLAMGPGLTEWFAIDGALPPVAVKRIMELSGGPGADFHPSYLNMLPGSTALYVIHAVAVIVSLAFAFGLLTRVSGLLTLVALLAYVHRAPQIAGHLEPVLSFLVGYLTIAPSGAYLSVDRRVFGVGKKSAIIATLTGTADQTLAANISLRLIQVHVAMFYAMMGLSKLYGDAWWQGSAIWILLAQTDSRPLDVSGIRRAGPIGEYAVNFVTHLIVYFELAFPVLIWTRIGRPLLLALSLVSWMIIILATGHLLFGVAMLATGLAFVPAERLRSLIGVPVEDRPEATLGPSAAA